MRGLSEAIDHAWLVQCVAHRLGDQRVVRHLRTWRKAGVLEEGPWRPPEAGTPQGGRARPLRAHLSLHEVLDLWAAQWRRRHARGEGSSVRSGDEGLVGVPHRDEAAQWLSALRERCHRGHLALHPEKTRLIALGRSARARRQRRGQGQPEPCDVLGVPPRYGATKRGKCTVRRGPIAPRLRQHLPEGTQPLRARRHGPSEQRGAWRQSVVSGHDRYSGVPRTRGRLGGLPGTSTPVLVWHRTTAPAAPSPDLATEGPTRHPVAAGPPQDASVSRATLVRHDPRQAPGAVVPHAGIWAGGAGELASLPRPSKRCAMKHWQLRVISDNMILSFCKEDC